MAIAYSVRISGGGIYSFLGFEYCDVITLASESFEYFLRFFQRACGVCAFLASSGSQVVATSPFFPTLTVYCNEVPFLGFYPCVAFVRATVALATIAGTITAPILLLALRSAADVAVSRFFALVWGLLLFLRNFFFSSLATLMVYRFLLRLSILHFSLSYYS